MRALLLAMAMGLAAQEAAALSLTAYPQPGSVIAGQNITVLVSVSNGPGSTVYGVSTTVQVNGTASAALVATPAPVTQDIAASASADFTWVFQSQGGGQVSFSAYASGYQGGTVTASDSTGQVPVATVTSTPSPSPTLTPTPIVSTTATPTATPWIVYGTATPAPLFGDANIPGNLFHPDQGQLLQLRYNVPLEGTVHIDLYNRIGAHIRHFERAVSPGSYTELWDGRNDQGLLVATGIYVAQFKAKGLFKTVKFAVVK